MPLEGEPRRQDTPRNGISECLLLLPYKGERGETDPRVQICEGPRVAELVAHEEVRILSLQDQID